MEKAVKASFQFEDFKVLKSQFEMKGTLNNEFEIGFTPRGKYNKDLGKFVLIFDVVVHSTDNNFVSEFHTVSTFSFEQDIEEERMMSFFSGNGPAIIFPYFRAYISGMTSLAGTGSILLPTFNMVHVAESLRESIDEVSEDELQEYLF